MYNQIHEYFDGNFSNSNEVFVKGSIQNKQHCLPVIVTNIKAILDMKKVSKPFLSL